MDTKSIRVQAPIALSLLAGFLTGCAVDGGQQGNQQSAPATPVVKVESLDTTIYQDYVANIQAFKNVEIRSRLKGFLEKIYVDEGSEVSQGQPLFKLNDTEYASEVARCEAVLENAIADGKTTALEVDRTKLLVAKNIVSETDLEVAEARLAAAESKIKEAKSLLQHAKAQLSYTTVRAPFTGRIDRIPLKEGSLLDEGALLTSISDLRQVYAYFDISEQEYLSIVANDSARTVDFSMPVTLTLANGTIYPHAGTAEFAENEFEESTGTISLRALFPNPAGLIKHAASGKVSVPMQRGENLVVHQKSVFEIQDRTYVYKVKDSGTLVMTPFRAGPRVGHYYLVEDGLSTSDTIVFEGVQNLRDGMTISPKMTSLADHTLAASGTQ
ncbi:efflux RND transporter periplasmic adaptor subunit [Parapedobacter sp. ISTM3]|uniref:Membrane fusion protein, multidrug efflux system n=1 Tax=Parapedobacter luteus TaxID=623280 RepID=A0A1T5E4E7_9SPHI|nr:MULTISPECIES: efflux RND transporter periplasmic adaptor subunit [Parapedobacter]MBK1441072.1 efflux RND transporter periplasmic adaptor subunit [Parapedobacter sp. ISTM3]SKB78797.1 membrane fusion protein, multidrug efflux system [Parapedobacter luteus]